MRYGRLPRTFDPRVPHWSALRLAADVQLPQPPPSVDYYSKLPAIGMLGNDQWGCCAEAGAYHLYQLWVFNATGVMPQITTDLALQLYTEVTGFNPNAGAPGSNPTDQGTVLQELLAYWLNTGIPLADGSRHKIVGYFEVDPRNAFDLNLGTAESAGLYLGFNVPKYLEQLEAPGSVWGDPPAGADTTIVGGHCTTSGGYAVAGNREIESWGSTGYAMTPSFWNANVDEAYVLVSQDFVGPDGKTPYGIPIAAWDQQMGAIKEAA